MRAAIEQGQLLLHYQPKVDLATGAVIGAEALVRWQHPERGLVPPADFIQAAEQTGLIRPLTYYVLDSALEQCRRWGEQGFSMPVAVNVSVDSFNDPDFLDRLEELLRTKNVSPRLLQLEITETVLMKEPASAHDVLERLAGRGVRVSIDDFGIDYSSLAYLSSLPICALKIDRSFVTRMSSSPRTCKVVSAIISLARSLAIKSIAEGVDAREQAETLIAMGCDEIQGFFFCRPVEAEELKHWAERFSLESYALGRPE